jgi:hypothetical protein
MADMLRRWATAKPARPAHQHRRARAGADFCLALALVTTGLIGLVLAGCGTAQSDPVVGPPPATGERWTPAQSGDSGDGINVENGSRTDGAQLVREAARRTAVLPTARYVLTLSWQGDGEVSPVLQVDGQVDLPAGKSSAIVRQWLATGDSRWALGAGAPLETPGASASGGSQPASPDVVGAAPTEVVVDGPWLYIRSESLGEVAGTGSAWLRLATGPDDRPTPTAVTGLLALLDLAVSADQGAADTVAGVPARRLRVVLGGSPPSPSSPPPSPEGKSGGPSPPPTASGDLGGFALIGDQVVVWVGDDGLVRAVEAVVQGTVPASERSGRRLVMRYELVDVGGVVDIVVPAADEVIEVNGGP